MMKTRNGSRSRPGSGVGDNSRMLQDTVVRLEEELIQSRAETKRMSDQLNCLMLLVKRAWTGDKSAATNVANIVGVAPPEFDEINAGTYTTVTAKPKVTDEETIEPPRVWMKNKSPSVNHWALLTIGVLNREYKRLEKKQELKVKLYLQNRQRYLQEQLLHHRDTRVREQVEIEARQPLEHIQEYDPTERIAQPTPLQQLEPTHKPLRRSNSLTELGSMRQQRGSAVQEQPPASKAFITQPNHRQPVGRPQTCKVRGTGRQLYRPPSGHNTVPEQSNLTWADLIVEPGQPHTEENGGTQLVTGSLYKMTDGNKDKVERRQRSKFRIPYDHPDRYTVNGLYDADNALGPGNSVFRKRPPSSKIQRVSDNMRARPKSAVYGQGERPMKYETTRPVSAIVSKSKNASHATKRPPSGKITNSSKSAPPGGRRVKEASRNNHNNENSSEGETEQGQGERNGHDPDLGPWNDSVDEEEDVEKLVYDDSAFSKLGIDMKEVEREVRQARALRGNVTKPQCVLDFEEDVKNMVAMESQIRKTTQDLQRKLGICENGMV